jgi:hypothetical protein
MPLGDGTGPKGQGPGTGRGMSGSRGRMGGNRPGSGPAGKCVCPKCGAEKPHQAGAPCYQQSCPKCGTRMVKK